MKKRIIKYFHLLDLDPASTFDEVKKAYKVKVKQWHPDRFTHTPWRQELANENLKELNIAYEKLKSYFASGAKPYIETFGHTKNSPVHSTHDEPHKINPSMFKRFISLLGESIRYIPLKHFIKSFYRFIREAEKWKGFRDDSGLSNDLNNGITRGKSFEDILEEVSEKRRKTRHSNSR